MGIEFHPDELLNTQTGLGCWRWSSGHRACSFHLPAEETCKDPAAKSFIRSQFGVHPQKVASQRTNSSGADGKGWFRNTVPFKESRGLTTYSPGAFTGCDVFIRSGTECAIATCLFEERASCGGARGFACWAPSCVCLGVIPL